MESASSQQLSLSYERVLDDLRDIYSVTHTDNGFALYYGRANTGLNRYVRLRNNNTLVWETQTNIYPNDIKVRKFHEDVSGYYFVSEGSANFGRINKTTGNFEVLINNNNLPNRAINSTYGGNFIIGGDSGNWPTTASLAVLSPLGALQTIKTTNETGGLWGSSVYQILQTKDNGYLLVGLIYENTNACGGELANKSLWLCKLNSSLNVIWSRKYGNGNGSIDRAELSDYVGPKAIILDNNEIVLLGETICTDGTGGGPNNTGDGKWLMKLNSSGNIIDIKIPIDINYLDFTRTYTDIELSCDGTILLCGIEGGLLGNSYFIEKYSTNLESVGFILNQPLNLSVGRLELQKGKDNTYLISGIDYTIIQFIAKTTVDPGCNNGTLCTFSSSYTSFSDCDNFDSYNNGNLTSQASPRFTLFSNNPNQEATIVSNSPQNNTKAVRIGNNTDIDYNVGNSPTGRSITTTARLEWRMYLPAGKTGSWGIETNNTSYAINVSYANGTATLSSGGNVQKTFGYSQNKWLNTALIFSTDKNTIECWIEKELIYTVTNFQSDQITDLNFYGTSNSSNNEYYVDDLLYYEIKANGCISDNTYNPVCINGEEYHNANFALCSGYTDKEWVIGNCCSGTPQYVNCGSSGGITHYYSGDGNTLRYTFNTSGQIAQGYQWLIRRDGNVISNNGGNASTVNVTFSNPGNYEVCYPRLNNQGCVEYCCYPVTVENPFNCNSIIYRYNPNSNSFSFAAQSGGSNGQWLVDNGTNAPTVLPGGTLPVPGTCVKRTISYRYFDGTYWRYCCRSIWICNPFTCGNEGNITYKYTQNNQFQFTLLNASQFSNISWQIDEPNPINIGSGGTVTWYPNSGNDCRAYTISVRYFDASCNCWRICCRSVYVCNPFTCGNISVGYRPSSNQFTFAINGTGGQSNQFAWTLDDTNTPIGGGQQVNYIPPGNLNCGRYIYSVRFWDGFTWRICCIPVYICNPSNCGGDIYYSYNNGLLTLSTKSSYNVINWYIEDNPIGSNTNVNNGTYTISLLYYDNIQQQYGVCKKVITLTTTSSENTVINKSNIYPNPTNDKIVIESQHQIISIVLFDINGQKIKANQENNIVDMSVLAAGVYVIQIETSLGVEFHKIIKIE